jgi:D-alanine-D-alanine ligase
VIQEFITGWETETPVLISDAAIALDPVGISVDEHLEIGERFLDYATANNDKYRFFDFEQTDAALSERVREAAARAALVLGLTGIARIDFRISSSGECYIIDITGKPHLSQHSSVAARFGMLGYRYRDIFSMLVGLAGARS